MTFGFRALIFVSRFNFYHEVVRVTWVCQVAWDGALLLRQMNHSMVYVRHVNFNGRGFDYHVIFTQPAGVN